MFSHFTWNKNVNSKSEVMWTLNSIFIGIWIKTIHCSHLSTCCMHIDIEIIIHLNFISYFSFKPVSHSHNDYRWVSFAYRFTFEIKKVVYTEISESDIHKWFAEMNHVQNNSFMSLGIVNNKKNQQLFGLRKKCFRINFSFY